MKRVIAILASLDTKSAEVGFLKEKIEAGGFGTFVIDLSARGGHNCQSDVGCEDVTLAAGVSFGQIADAPKHEVITALTDGLCVLLPSLYRQGRFHGVLSAGGLQNTVMATGAMRLLPIGVPKLMLSTVACGGRSFGPFVGTGDIVMIPSIADLAGLNPVTEVMLSNLAAACMGMVERAGRTVIKKGTLIGATLMGVTNDGVTRAVGLLEEAGTQVVSFHSTGVGGRCMEELIQSGIIDAAMDLTLHEITSGEVFGAGFSAGTIGRLKVGAEKGIPMVVAPGGVDFVDFTVKEFLSGIIGDPDLRKYNLHNSEVAHIKVFKEEIIRAGELIVERLNASRGPVTMMIPLRGFRANTLEGQSLYDPEVDQALVQVLETGLAPSVRIVRVDSNLNDEKFSRAAAEEMLSLLGQVTADAMCEIDENNRKV